MPKNPPPKNGRKLPAKHVLSLVYPELSLPRAPSRGREVLKAANIAAAIFLLISFFAFSTVTFENVGIGYYESGETRYIVKYISGMLDKHVMWYHENGNIKSIIRYENGIRDSTASWYYKNGNLKAVIKYYHGLKDSICIWYYENGKVKRLEYQNVIILMAQFIWKPLMKMICIMVK
jgi:hypothetical protein